MRLALTFLCSIAVLTGAAPLVAHAAPLCETAGWTDPVTGAHPEDGPCTPVDVGDVSCRNTSASDGSSVAVSVTVCVPKAIKVG